MQSGVSYRLVVRQGPQPSQLFELTDDDLTIGRDITNDVPLNDPEVSRQHARMARTDAGYTIEDLNSTNGTFVNQERVTEPRVLAHGDVIGLGELVTLVYEMVGAHWTATVVGAPTIVRVHVSGAVANPNVYALPANAIVRDALQAAGGTTEEADLERVNLAEVLKDGQKLHIPRVGEEV